MNAALFVAIVLAALTPTSYELSESYKDRGVMNEICSLIKEDCSQIEAPTVVISHVVPPGYYGLYFHDERFVFISRSLPMDNVTILMAEIHETTHYILYEIHGEEISSCESERYARSVTALLTDTEVDPKWEQRYGCALIIEGMD